MSGKLIMKRKLDKTKSSAINNKEELNETSASTLPSSSSSVIYQQKKESKKTDEEYVTGPESKRLCCDTPPPETDDLDLLSIQEDKRPNRHLLEAIQLKILELQNELDDFENDIAAHEEYSYTNQPQQSNEMMEHNAESLGFAMCAQETMLFLQKEGIPSDSLLYTRLVDALVGRSQSDSKQ